MTKSHSGLLRQPRAVVTGAASGLGRAFCTELIARGARVLAADTNELGLRSLAESLHHPDRLHTQVCSVADAAQVESLAVQAESLWGGTDLLINNAGVAATGGVGEVSLADWEWIMGVNLWGVIYGCHSFVPRMKAVGSGWVLNVASIAGLVGVANMAPYNVTKFAVVGLSECMRAELKEHGVGVSVLCPSFFKTNIIASGRISGEDGEKSKRAGEKLMDVAKMSAQDVARFALDGAQKGKFFLLPQPDARVLWGAKRIVPELFPSIISAVRKWM
jgi:NAD(P)-dependent dehydrogenase (short-subunit alcohol dehydrogenase family)